MLPLASGVIGTIEPSSLIVAVATFLTAVYGIKSTRSGKETEKRQQSAANELQTRAQDHDVYRDLVTDLRAEVARKDTVIAAGEDRVAELTGQMVQERLEHRAEISHMRDIIATLQNVVHAEIAKMIAEDGLGGFPPMMDQGPGRHGITDETPREE